MSEEPSRPPWQLLIKYADGFDGEFEVEGSLAQCFEAAFEFSMYEGVAIVYAYGTKGPKDGYLIKLAAYINGQVQEDTV